MQGREIVLEDLMQTVNGMLEEIELREPTEPDFAIVREIAEQLKEELESLQD